MPITFIASFKSELLVVYWLVKLFPRKVNTCIIIISPTYHVITLTHSNHYTCNYCTYRLFYNKNFLFAAPSMYDSFSLHMNLYSIQKTDKNETGLCRFSFVGAFYWRLVFKCYTHIFDPWCIPLSRYLRRVCNLRQTNLFAILRYSTVVWEHLAMRILFVTMDFCEIWPILV